MSTRSCSSNRAASSSAEPVRRRGKPTQPACGRTPLEELEVLGEKAVNKGHVPAKEGGPGSAPARGRAPRSAISAPRISLGALLPAAVDSRAAATRASSERSRVANQPIRSPARPKAFDMTPMLTAPPPRLDRRGQTLLGVVLEQAVDLVRHEVRAGLRGQRCKGVERVLWGERPSGVVGEVGRPARRECWGAAGPAPRRRRA